MQLATDWFVSRVTFVEASRAIGLASGSAAVGRFTREWSAFSVVELDHVVAESAAAFTYKHNLRSLDAIHLASALVLPTEDLTFLTWDQRQHAAAYAEGLTTLPDHLYA